MNNQCTVGIFDSIDNAESAVYVLTDNAIPASQISVITQHINPDSDFVHELNFEDDSLRDAVIGAAFGGLTGIIVDATLIIGTGGWIILGGPIVAVTNAAIVAATSVAVGGFLGSLAGSGVHHALIQKYESLVNGGKVLVIADGDPLQVNLALRLFQANGALEVHSFATTGDGDSQENA